MRIEVTCYIINLRVYGNPAITIIAMLLQIMEAKSVGRISRHNEI